MVMGVHEYHGDLQHQLTLKYKVDQWHPLHSILSFVDGYIYVCHVSMGPPSWSLELVKAIFVISD